MTVDVLLDTKHKDLRRGVHVVTDGVHKLKFAWRMHPNNKKYWWACIGYSANGTGVRRGQWSHLLVTRFRTTLVRHISEGAATVSTKGARQNPLADNDGLRKHASHAGTFASHSVKE